MAKKVLVGQLVDFYWEVYATKEEMEANNADVESITAISDLLIDLDKILTGASKRWAKGIREPKAVLEPHYPL